MPGQTVSSITYDRVTTTTTPTTLPVAIEQSGTTTVAKDELYMTLNTGATAQVSSFTITGTPAAEDIIFATIAVTGGYSFKYTYELNASDTVETAGQRLARLIDTDVNVVASASFATGTSTITITSTIPGQAFTLTTGKTSSGLTVSTGTTVTSNAGTAMRRKLAECTWTFDDSSDGFLTAKGQVKFYDGASSPVLLTTQDTAAYKHSRSIETIRTAQGAS